MLKTLLNLWWIQKRRTFDWKRLGWLLYILLIIISGIISAYIQIRKDGNLNMQNDVTQKIAIPLVMTFSVMGILMKLLMKQEAAGMDDYLGKPFNISDLEGILKKHIRKTVYDKYDLGKISTSIGVTPEVALQYIERFLDAFSKELKDMEGYAKSGDFAALRITAHKYKGTAGMFGFDEARQTLGAIESKAKGLLASGGDVQSDSISPDSIFRDD